jgi:dTDP-4-amino-4,6-dideoxygalactose transaminase
MIEYINKKDHTNALLGNSTPATKSFPDQAFLLHSLTRSIDRLSSPSRQLSMSLSNDLRWCPRKPFNAERVTGYLKNSLDNNHVTNDGPLQAVLAEKLRSYVGCDNTVLLAANGTAALHSIASGYSLKFGRPLVWATQAFTFPSSIQGPFERAIIVDSASTDCVGPCLSALESMKNSIDGVVVTNVFGLQEDVLTYERWCKANGKLLIFDNAATSIGTTQDGRCIHDIGDGSMISLHETKPLGRGEGGALFVPHDIAKFCHQAMNFGFNIPMGVRVGHRYCSNWRMSDIAAAAIADHLDTVVEQDWIATQGKMLTELLPYMSEKGLFFPKRLYLSERSLLACLFIKLPSTCSGKVDNICKELNDYQPNKIEAKHYYRPLCDEGTGPLAWEMYASTLCMPFHVQMNIADLKKAVDRICELCAKHSVSASCEEFTVRDCLSQPNKTGVTVSHTDTKYFPHLRLFVKEFMMRCAATYGQEGKLLLDIAPETHEGASPFKSFGVNVKTLDIIPGADYCADLTKDNSGTIPGRYFDMVVCTEVLEHTSQPFNSMAEINRVLKQEGLLFLSVPCNFRMHGPLPDSWRFTEWGVRQLCEQHGFELVELTALESSERSLFPLDYAAVCRKL